MIFGDRWKKLNRTSIFYRISKNSRKVVLEPNHANIAASHIWQPVADRMLTLLLTTDSSVIL